MQQNRTITYTRAKIAHAEGIHKLITYWSQRSTVLSKSLGHVYETLREFVVALDGEEVVGCAAMHIDWADLAEIRSVAVSPNHQGSGIGRKLVETLVEEAADLGIAKVFCLTDKPDWFSRLGFGMIDKADLPHKVWRDCVHCPIFTHCTEIAMGKNVK